MRPGIDFQGDRHREIFRAIIIVRFPVVVKWQKKETRRLRLSHEYMNTGQIFALAMLLGSIPVKRIFVKQAQLSDIELALIGALNAVKVGLPVFLAANFLSPKIAILACIIGVLSSCFPYWLMFKPQGKGFAELLGAVIGLNPLAGICALAVWAGVLLVFDRYSIATISVAVVTPILLKVFHAPIGYIGLAIIVCAYVIIAHSANITRLIDGSEPHWKRNK